MIISYTNKYGHKVFDKEISFKSLEKQLKNPKFYKNAVIILGCTLYIVANGYNPVVYAYGPAKINALGIKFWAYVKVFAKWACLIMAGVDTVKSLNAGDTKTLNKIIFKYILAYAVVALLPEVFEEMETFTK